MRWAGSVGAAMIIVAAASGPAMAADTSTAPARTYLALGDSVPFGYNPFILPTDPTQFVGYPEDAATALGLDLTNASCPGEASGGFINPTGTDNGCRPFRAQFPLHVSYAGPQLAYAVSYLGSHRGTALVSLTLGANDLFVCQQHTTDGCAAPAELAATLTTYQQNLTRILSRIRAVYHGQLVAVTYYSTNYTDPRVTVPIAAINAVTTAVTTRFGGQVADGFTAFARAAASSGGNSCTAGLLLKNPADSTGQTCDIHPSTTGAQLLATTLAAAVDAPGNQAA